jgi:hypothetical protein
MTSQAGFARVGDMRVAMLHYGVGTEHVHATMIDQGGVLHSLRLAKVEQVAPHVERLVWMLRAPTRFPASELSNALHSFSVDWGRRLLPATELLAGYDVLVVVPHHFVHDLPLQVVRIGDAAECLGNRFGISYCSSATLFERAVDRNPARAGGVAEWLFPLSGGVPIGAPGPPGRCCALGVDVLGGDSRYRELAEACAGLFPDRSLLLGRDQLKSRVVQDADVICLVCHGVMNEQEHDESGLLLRGRRGIRSELTLRLHLGQWFSFRDLPFSYVPPQLDVAPEFQADPLLPELMTISEVRTFLEIRAQLVMLLGCSTATGQLRSGDSYASLAYQWLQAGAVSVLGHQWEADFPFVAGWVPVFLDYWIRRRQPKAIAVRESLNQVLADGLAPRDALHLWGAVVLLGDWI